LTVVAGRVVDGGGAAVPDARVMIVAGSVPMPEIALLADAQGRFSLRLPPGVFTLAAYGATGSGQAEVTSPARGEVRIVIR